ncbi:putative glycosyl hydrolase, family 18 [Kalaharituber pfeilii]|nr:putative glycosyl hydrolase, family 18 [Kalaharituber pfeilii]
MQLATFASFGIVTISTLSTLASAAWNISANNNVVTYWGQNAFGSFNNETARQQKGLLYYCKNTAADLIPIGFLNKWPTKSGQLEVNFSNACTGWEMFLGTNLLWCPTISQDIIACQQTYGKKILISLGGGAPTYRGWPNRTDAKLFAEKVWAMFGKGWSYYRPFGEAVVDGFDLDFEHGPSDGYQHVAYRLRQLMNEDQAKTGKQWILTAAPQCPLPDANLDAALRNVAFDAIFVQFYNNECHTGKWALGLPQNTNQAFNFAMWDTYAKTIAKNKHMKVFLTVPLAREAATNGYISRVVAAKVISDLKRYSSFGGLAGWDASFGDQNIGYISAVKKALET